MNIRQLKVKVLTGADDAAVQAALAAFIAALGNQRDAEYVESHMAVRADDSIVLTILYV